MAHSPPAAFAPSISASIRKFLKSSKIFLKSIKVDFQLTPTGSHQRNTAERAMRAFKNHFVAIPCSTDDAFPLKLWDRPLEQALITLNLLRGSRVNPQLSAQAQLHGAFDFNRTPLGLPGTQVLIHELPDKRGTWSPHVVLGFHTGPASKHCQCHRAWVLETGSKRVANTLLWFPTQVPLPRTSSTDAATSATQDLIHALDDPHTASPLSPIAPSPTNTRPPSNNSPPSSTPLHRLRRQLPGWNI
jgi:hypothetical protein